MMPRESCRNSARLPPWEGARGSGCAPPPFGSARPAPRAGARGLLRGRRAALLRAIPGPWHGAPAAAARPLASPLPTCLLRRPSASALARSSSRLLRGSGDDSGGGDWIDGSSGSCRAVAVAAVVVAAMAGRYAWRIHYYIMFSCSALPYTTRHWTARRHASGLRECVCLHIVCRYTMICYVMLAFACTYTL